MVTKITKLVNLFAVMLVVAGCVSFSYDIPSKIAVEDGKGVVLLSTGAKSKNAAGSHNLLIKDASGKIVESLHINNLVLKSHFDDHVGFVHAVNLAEGEYEVSSEVLNTLYRAKNRETPPTFKVKAGEIIYLGEVFLVGEPEFLRVTNKLNRDLVKLNSNGAKLKLESIKTKLLSL